MQKPNDKGKRYRRKFVRDSKNGSVISKIVIPKKWLEV
jgi:phage anti-repressor protein